MNASFSPSTKNELRFSITNLPSEIKYPDLSHIRHAVFAGGGNRCFWQAGFWNSIAEALNLKPQIFISVSAGSAISSAIIANRMMETLQVTRRMIEKNAYNHRWQNLVKGEPVFPHERIYRQIVTEVLQGEGLEKLKAGPENLIAITRIPKWLGARSATALGLGAYQLEKKLKHPVHPIAGKKLGFTAEFISTHHQTSLTDVANLILASSCTPPFTPLMYWNNRPALDGGLVDNVPVHGIKKPESPTLVLLSRPYPQLPTHPNRIYVQPSQKVPVKAWDYTNPEGIQETFDQGRRDGDQFLNLFRHTEI